MCPVGPLATAELVLPARGELSAYAASLLELLGAGIVPGGDRTGTGDPSAAARDWAASGAMALTGTADGPPVFPGWATASTVRGAAEALSVLSAASGVPVDLDGPALLGERAAFTGATRSGAAAPGGSCRLLRVADGWLAVNLARESDIELLPAWLDGAPVDASDRWGSVGLHVRGRRRQELVERAGPLGLAVGAAPSPAEAEAEARAGTRPPFTVTRHAPARTAVRDPLVIDLSSLWAGPLCANLLGLAGARVVKVESASRPDGARHGNAGFFDLLHAGHESVVLELDAPSGRASLQGLVERADVVIEASRPRALQHLGLDAERHARRGGVWISVTAYGRTPPLGDRVGFGDDVGIAAGMVAGPPATPGFCGDAIADPVAGLHAAVAALGCLLGGGGFVADVGMHQALRAGLGARRTEVAGRATSTGWSLDLGSEAVEVARPRARRTGAAARDLGADTERVLRELRSTR